MRIVIDGDSVNAQFEQGAWTDDDANLSVTRDGEEFAVGNSLTISETGSDISDLASGNEYRIRLIHVPSESVLLDQEVTLR